MLWSGCGDCEAVEFVTEVTELIPGFFAQKQGLKHEGNDAANNG